MLVEMCEVPHTLAWETGLAADMLAAMDGSVDRDFRDSNRFTSSDIMRKGCE
jgi:hypothetical protein